VAGWRSPRTREFASDSVFACRPVASSGATALGVGSRAAVALSVWWCTGACPSIPYRRQSSLQWSRYLYERVERGGAVLLCFAVVVVCTVVAELMSQSNPPVRIVVR
jgi:hypothetical protein